MNANENEMLRHAVLECLVLRHPNAVLTAGVRRAVTSQLPFAVTEQECRGALEVLAGLGLVKNEVDEMGSSQWWTATALGVLKQERG